MPIKFDQLPAAVKSLLDRLIIITGRDPVSEILSLADTTSDNALGKLKAKFPIQYAQATENLEHFTSTIGYYDTNFATFYATDRHPKPHRYEVPSEYLPDDVKLRILDLGCGVGGDLEYFSKKGYKAIGVDASKEMVRLAKETVPQCDVILSSFQSLPFHAKTFDLVWAQASLIHVPYEETECVFKEIHRVLDLHGKFYAAYKEGKGPFQVGQRWFYRMDEDTLMPILTKYFNPLKIWTRVDQSKVSSQYDTRWLCFVAERKEIADFGSPLEPNSDTQQSKSSSASSDSSIKQRDAPGHTATQSDHSNTKDAYSATASQTQHDNDGTRQRQTHAADAVFNNKLKHAGQSITKELVKELEIKLQDCDKMLISGVANYCKKQIEHQMELLKEKFQDTLSIYKEPKGNYQRRVL